MVRCALLAYIPFLVACGVEGGAGGGGGMDVVAACEPDTEKLEFIEEMTILARNNGAEYLRRHGMEGRTDWEAFKAHVPVVTYEDLRPEIERIANGDRSNIISSHPIRPSPSSSPDHVLLLRESQVALGPELLGVEEEARSERRPATVSALLAGHRLFPSPCALAGDEGWLGGREKNAPVAPLLSSVHREDVPRHRHVGR